MAIASVLGNCLGWVAPQWPEQALWPAVRIAKRLGVRLPDSPVDRIRKRYERLAYYRGLEPLAWGRRGRKKRRPGHNLALRLRDHQADMLRFLADSEVPFTNNLAEQNLRMKISGGFRTEQGARDFMREGSCSESLGDHRTLRAFSPDRARIMLPASMARGRGACT